MKTGFKVGIIVLSAVLVGVIIGVSMQKKKVEPEVPHEEINPKDYQVDAKALLDEYTSNPEKDFTIAELVNVGLQKYRECENSYFIGIGNASTIVDQTIRSAQIKNGDHYLNEAISRSAIVSIANRYTQVGVNQGATLYKGKAKTVDTGTYKDEPVQYTTEEFKAAWGVTLDEVFLYIISDKTVIQENCSKTTTDEGNIEIKLDLNVDISPYYYKMQMKSVSKLSSLPVFEDIKLVYTFKSDMTLLRCDVDETYTAKKIGINASVHNEITYYYYADKYVEIPSLNQPIDYTIIEQ